MSEKDNGNANLDVENTMKSVLGGDTLKNALDFIAYVRENDMIAGGTHGEVSFQGKCVCYMHLDGAPQRPGPWTIWTEGDYGEVREDVLIDKHIKEIAWAHVNFCGDCGGGCSPGTRKTILGKEFDSVCGASMAFTNPDAETMECVKKMLDMRKNSLMTL